MHGLPLLARQQIAAFGGVNLRQMQDFGGIEIADSGDGALIEQGDLDCPSAVAQPLAKLVGRKSQCIWTHASIAELTQRIAVR